MLVWFRPAPAETQQVDALELLADHDHPLLGVRNHSRQELAGVQRRKPNGDNAGGAADMPRLERGGREPLLVADLIGDLVRAHKSA